MWILLALIVTRGQEAAKPSIRAPRKPKSEITLHTEHTSVRQTLRTELDVVDMFRWKSHYWPVTGSWLRRELLNAVCLNRSLTDLSLETTKRKPFDILAEGLEIKKSRGDWI